ncbi:MAG: hypothetical protein G01um101420_845 [Parcubacteria group bacterium Gr01-1014_20]|nr:MAG: hypothetical protein G01um101420_845 [Parcubacteria group bacterium Gr01-1014_20]
MRLRDDEVAKAYKPPAITDRQMAALEAIIIKSKDANDFAKRAIIWTLRQTENLTKSVALSLWYKDFGMDQVDAVQDGSHDMNSCNGSTHLYYFFEALATEVGLSEHCGCSVPMREGGNVHINEAAGITIWFSHIFYDPRAILLVKPSKEDLESIALSVNNYRKEQST